MGNIQHSTKPKSLSSRTRACAREGPYDTAGFSIGVGEHYLGGVHDLIDGNATYADVGSLSRPLSGRVRDDSRLAFWLNAEY
jgi:hypothetical protein